MNETLFPLHRSPELRAAVQRLAEAEGEERGAVFTRAQIVELMLDLAGYTADQALHKRRLLEPSFGAGDFLLPALNRLWSAFLADGGSAGDIRTLSPAIRAVEVHRDTFDATRAEVLARLTDWGVSVADAEATIHQWLVHDDFLLSPIAPGFDFVIGNPPYVRQERIPPTLLEEYRRRYRTVYDRADLYIPFFERALDLLRPEGTLAYICANRWMKNKYGGPLRTLISSAWRLRYYIDLEGAPAFQSEVLAYAAITVLVGGQRGPTLVSRRPDTDPQALQSLSAALRSGAAPQDPRVEEFQLTGAGADPWLLEVPDRTRLIRKLEGAYPSLEEAGCKVGIGVATGIDKRYIGPLDELPVEDERKLPLVMAGDLDRTHLKWRGKGVINPFEADGTLADLAKWPRFAAYLRAHEPEISARHCAKKSPQSWYKTIDRITPELVRVPKLLIPDIKGEATVVLDEGNFYPHHNLYYITSDTWELPALATVLRSSLATLFVATYCVKMSGGFLRFQAQYLRRIRLPNWHDLSLQARTALREASATTDLERIDAAVALAYQLSEPEVACVRAGASEARVKPKSSK